MTNNIKWAAIQPLTGGLYLGTEEAIGHPAEWILTYKGLNTIKKDKDDNVTGVGNEAYLLNYLHKVDREVPYYQMNREMFDTNLDDMNPEILLNDEPAKPNYENLDLVVALPVCSGLSMVTSAGQETKDGRNCNMLYLAKLALTTIKPKIYIFENAPTFMGERGDSLRIRLEKLAKDNGYLIVYYKTDTHKHYNCQRRPRTFIFFIRKDVTNNQLPVLDFEDKPMSIQEFFDNIPYGLTNQEECKPRPHNYILLDFFKEKYGEEWFKTLDNKCLMKLIVTDKLFDELFEYCKTYTKISEDDMNKSIKYFKHVKDKTDRKLNWFGSDIVFYKKELPSVQFRSITTTMHPNCKRVLTVRENLELMGMPHDFDWFGDESNLPKIAQNVPVKTAKFIMSQAVNILENNINIFMDGNVLYINNINNKIQLVA